MEGSSGWKEDTGYCSWGSLVLALPLLIMSCRDAINSSGEDGVRIVLQKICHELKQIGRKTMHFHFSPFYHIPITKERGLPCWVEPLKHCRRATAFGARSRDNFNFD